MLARRLEKVFNPRKGAVLVRFYFAGNNVHSNLESRSSVLRNSRSSFGKHVISECRSQEWATNNMKMRKTISKLCHTQTNGDVRSKENGYAHTVLKRRGAKSIAIPVEVNINVTDEEVDRILNNEWQDSSPEDTLQAFKSLSYHAKLNSVQLEEKKHEPILEALCGKLVDLDDDKLRQVFQCLQLWSNIQQKALWPPYANLWMELDRECLKRFNGWSMDETLLACDYLSNLYLAKKTKYPLEALKKVGRKPKKMNADTLLTFLYLINTCRKTPVNMYEVEYQMQGMLDEFTVDELGIIAMGFFKSQTPIRDPSIIREILLKLLQEIETISEITINAIMKLTRYSKALKEVIVLERVLLALKSRVPNVKIPCLTSIMHTAAFYQMYVPETMNIIIERMTREIDTARLKDLERLTWSLGMFDYNPDSELFKNLTENLNSPRRKIEFEEFPKSSATMLAHLSQIGIFPLDMIKQHFDPCFIQQAYSNNPYKIGYNYFTLETNVKIDLPEYDGPFLKPGIRDFLAKKFSPTEFQSSNKIRSADQLLLEITHMCKTILERDTSVYVDQVLPHYVKPDIIIAIDKNNNLIDPQPFLSEIPNGTIKYSSQVAKDLKWIAVVVATQNQMIKGTDKYVGPLMCKIRQLKKIGYTPIVVPHNFWTSLLTIKTKKEYLREQIFRVINHGAFVAAL